MADKLTETVERVALDKADWLLDAVACATQDRRFLRGDPEYDEAAGEAILLNGAKAIRVALAALSRPNVQVALTDEVRREALDLVRRVRAMTKSENIHARGIAKSGGESQTTSRDDADMDLANLYAAWPAGRLDRLRAALSRPNVDEMREALHEIDVIASNTIPPDGKDAAFAALNEIIKLINPFRRAALNGSGNHG